MSDEPITNRQKRILVIDDNEIILKTVSIKLQKAGFQVFTAINASRGVELARKEIPDMILLDIGFPLGTVGNRVVDGFTGVLWDGFRIMDWLHNVEETKNIPIVIISGMDDDKNKQRAQAGGVLAFFPKPLNFDEMLRVVRSALAAQLDDTVPAI